MNTIRVSCSAALLFCLACGTSAPMPKAELNPPAQKVVETSKEIPETPEEAIEAPKADPKTPTEATEVSKGEPETPKEAIEAPKADPETPKEATEIPEEITAAPVLEHCSKAWVAAAKADLLITCKNALPVSLSVPLLSAGPSAQKLLGNTFIVELSRNALVVDGFVVNATRWEEALVEKLEMKIEMLREFEWRKQRTLVPPYTLVLAVAPDVPMARLAKVLDVVVKRKFEVVQFLFEGPLPNYKTINLKVMRQIARLMKAPNTLERQQKLTQYVGRAARKCPEVGDAFKSLMSAAPDQACEILARGIPEGLEKCGCKVDVDRVVTPMIAMGYKQASILEITFGSGEALDLSGKTTWAKAAPVFLAASGRVVAPFW